MLVVSPSGYALAERCMRRWGYRILGVREPRTTALTTGVEAHAVARRYLKYRDTPDQTTQHGRWVAAGMHLLPPAHHALLLEAEWVITIDGVRFGGYIDCVDLTTKTVYDHKFVNGWRYIHTSKSLSEDPQFLLYSAAVGFTRGAWIYYDKRSARARRVEATTSDSEQACRDELLPLAKRMTAAHHAIMSCPPQIRWQTMHFLCQPNHRDCHSYGQLCPHTAYCTGA